MRKYIENTEISERIELNCKRLSDDKYYQIDEVFSPVDYDWYGDKEGRALLAFVSHYKISGKKIPCMEQMYKKFPEKLNEKGYLGIVSENIIYEQQLAGHSWLLRGICEHYEQFSDKESLYYIKSIINNLYMPKKGKFSTYPTDRSYENNGGVSGSETGTFGIWRLSSDIGCAFICIDGLSHAYKVLRSEELSALIEEVSDVFLSIDKYDLKAQTHATLTAARGLMRMYTLTGKDKYLNGAKSVYDLYTNGGGMTYTYQNLNWWQRPDTWTEPCAIIDSLILSLELFKATNEEDYRRYAARIFHNGFATLQRDNGGAGTDTLVCSGSPLNYLAAQMYEAYFCCTMRLAEGLWYINKNKDLLYAELEGKVKMNENGIYSDGDIIYAEPTGGLEKYADSFVTVDSHKLSPLIKYYKIPKDVIMNGRQILVFKH